MKRRIIGLFLIGMFTTLSYAAPFYIQDLGYSARYVANGGIQGFDSAPSGVFTNSAGLTRQSQGVSAFYTTYAEGDVYHYTLATGFSLSDKVRIGIGFSELGTTDIPVTEENNSTNEFIETGSFAYANRMAKIGVSVDLNSELTLGVGATGFQKTYYTITGEGMNMDIGLVWTPKLYPIRLAFTGHEILPGAVTYTDSDDENEEEDQEESFEATWSMSGVYTPYFCDRLNISGEATYHTISEIVSTSVGVAYFLTASERICVMGSIRDVVDINTVTKIPAMGLMVNLEPLQLEYAMEKSNFVDEEIKHYVSMSVLF